MIRMSQSNVLIIGMTGLGVEIGKKFYKVFIIRLLNVVNWFYFILYIFIWTAKNVVLAGVKSVTIYDPELIQISDLSSQVYIIIKSFIYY